MTSGRTPIPDPSPIEGEGGYVTSHHAPGAVGRAQRLRKVMTLPEKLLWAELRKLKINIRRQASIGRYVVDFASHRAALVVEIDGARHDLPEDQLHDFQRTQWLNSQGYRVIRFRNDHVLTDAPGVAEQIRAAINTPKTLPLDRGRLGGGADAVAVAVAERRLRETSPAILSSPPACTPPTLPPSRGKGEGALTLSVSTDETGG